MNAFFYKATIIIFFLFFVSIFQGYAQSISGRVTETGNGAVENATITLLNATDSSVVKYAVSNREGYFELGNLRNGTFAIRVTSIGYQTRIVSNIQFAGAALKLGDIALSRQSKELKEVTITNKTPILERKVDRLIFNLNNTLMANGGSLFETLQAAPLLTVSDAGVSMVGKGSMAVMVNEKIIYLSGAELANYLKTLRAENVEKIEIITTPPAKYEAQGNGGMINIVLKKNQSLGWRGSVSTLYLQNANSSYNNNLALYFRSKKISSSFTFNQYDYHSLIKDVSDIIGQSRQILNYEERRSTSPSLQGGLSIDYLLNKNNNIGFIYNISRNQSYINFANHTDFVTGNTLDSVLTTSGKTSRPLFTQTINLYHDLKLDSTGKKLNSSVNFFTNRPDFRNDFVSQSANTNARVQNNSTTSYHIWSVQSDLTLPFKWSKIETGAKFARFNNSADVEYYNITGQNYLLDSSRSNQFNYTENNLAAYYSMESELSKKWSAKVGLRYEYTMMDGYSPTLNQRNQRNYGALFPTAYLVYKAGANHTLSLNYSRRINRPSLNALNPFAYYTSIYNYYIGNPALLPSYSNNLELNYLYKGMLSLTVFTQHTTDMQSTLTTVTGPEVANKAGNYLTQDNIGGYISFNKALLKWWDNSTSVSFFYSSPKSNIAAIRVQSGSSAAFNINNSFKANKQLSFYLNYNQNLPSTAENSYRYAQRNLRAGARLMLLNNNFIISPSYFLGTVNKYDFRFSDFVHTLQTDYNYRTFNLSLTYLFGRSKVSGNDKYIKFDEKGRGQR